MALLSCDPGQLTRMKKLKIYSLIGLIFTLGYAQAAVGGLSNASTETVVLGKDEGRFGKPKIALWVDGGLMVCEGSGQDGYKRIIVQPINNNGATEGAPIICSQATKGIHDLKPRIKAVTGAVAVIVWVSGERGDENIFMRLVNRSGIPISEIMRVNENAAKGQTNPAVSASRGDGFIVGWESDGWDGDGKGIYAKAYQANGVAVGQEFLVAQTTKGDQSQPAALALGGGRYFITWVDDVINGRNEAGGLRLESRVMGRFFRNNIADRNEFKISTGQAIVGNPYLFLGGNGRIQVLWEERSDLNSVHRMDIKGSEVDISDALVYPIQGTINDHQKGDQSLPVGVSIDKDLTAVFWESIGQDGAGRGVVGRMVNGKSESVINLQRNYDQRAPDVAISSKGEMWVLWSNDISPTRSTIVLRKFGVGGVDLLDGELRVASGNDQLPPAAPVVEPLSPEGEGANLEGAGQGLKISRGPGNTIKMPEFPQPIEPQPNSYNINATETVAENVGSQPRNPRNISTARAASLAAIRQMAFKPANRDHSRIISSPQAVSGGSITPSRIELLRALSRGGGSITTRSQPRAQSRTGSRETLNNGVKMLATRQSQNPRESAVRMAKSRFEILREQAQLATSKNEFAGQRQVPAGLSIKSGVIALEWASRPGSRYQIQGSGDRVSWVNYGPVYTSKSKESSVTVDRKYRYYRVIEGH